MRENIHFVLMSVNMLGRILTNIFIHEDNLSILCFNKSYLLILNKLKIWADKLFFLKEV